MTFSVLSPKQKQVFKWCYKDDYKAIICDGAVRSGKTICMVTSFILWAMRRFNSATFGICGKTVRSAERNIIMPLQSIVDITAYFKVTYTRSVNLMTIEGCGHKNYFYVFGGKDESSYMLIQGITLSGVFFDEVALMPRSFVEQAMARTLSVENSKYWFNCNPDNQFHWFYTDWICDTSKKNALHIHFLMKDNPTLTTEQLELAENQFTGVFHDRYIKGLWVSAEGVIYKQFADNTEQFLIDTPPDDITFCQIGWDFGGDGSAHAGICTGFSKRLQKIVILDEYYRKEVITPTQMNNDVIDFVRRCQNTYGSVYEIYPDSAETTLIKGMETALISERVPIKVHKAYKGDILERIRFTNIIMAQHRLHIMRNCKHVISAFQTAVWDSKQHDDKRLDNGKYNIDSLDAFEYSVEKYMSQIIKIGGVLK